MRILGRAAETAASGLLLPRMMFCSCWRWDFLKDLGFFCKVDLGAAGDARLNGAIIYNICMKEMSVDTAEWSVSIGEMDRH